MDSETKQILAAAVALFAASFAVKYFVRRAIVSNFAKKYGMSYVDANKPFKAYAKNPSRETLNEFFRSEEFVL